MKTIRTRILVNMIATVMGSLMLIGVLSILLSYNSTTELLSQTMTESAKITADRVSMELQSYINVASETGSTARLASATTSISAKQELIDQRAKAYGFERGNVIGADGISLFDGKDYSDREYFIEAMAGNTHISEPLLSKVTNKLAMIIAAPLWKDGVPGAEVIGVVYFAPGASFLNDIASSIKISQNSSAYIVDDEGYTIAHKDTKRVEDRENVEELAKSKPELKVLASIHSNMRAKKNAFESYKFGGVSKFTAYAPIANTHNWSIAVSAPISDFMDGTIKSMWLTVGILIITIGYAIFVAYKAANIIGIPIKACTARLILLAKGDLKSTIPEVKAKDETGQLAEATKTIIDTLNAIIGDESRLLAEMANGNFNIKTNVEDQYIGDFNAILMSMREINTGLSNTLFKVNQAAEQVSAGSDQVSSGAQALAQGATEQASSVQELSASIVEISQQVNSNAENSRIARDQANLAGTGLTESNKKMQELIGAMTEISNSSSQIGKVIKTIEDIAFQTNILALNAAVEAARAGEAGKGFAVVADEVRNLAGKSALAAKGTTVLIQRSIQSVANGSKLAGEAATALMEAVDKATITAETVDKISKASTEQANSISQVTIGIDQISAVVQTNSATAEQSAAASEELSGQAAMMKALIAHFKLKGVKRNESEQYTQPQPQPQPQNEMRYRAPVKHENKHDFGGTGKY